MKNTVKIFFKVINFIILLKLCSCASLSDRKQFVRIVPPQSTDSIYVDQKEVGKGIDTIKITRQKKPIIKIGDQAPIPLKTKYRWGHSFGGNALTIVYAPFGWATDFITGAAWRAIHMKLDEAKDSINEHSKILVLPPQVDEDLAADPLTSLLEKWVKEQFPKSKVLESQEFKEKIASLGFDHNYQFSDEDPDEFNELLHETKASHIIASQYDEDNKELVISIYNPYSTRVIQQNTLTDISLDSIKDKSWFLKETFNFIPNTLSLGAIETGYGTCPDPQDKSAYCQHPKEENFLSFLSMISFSNVVHYRKRKSWRVYLRFYPDFTFSVNHIEIRPNTPSLPNIDAEIDWHFTSFGYGPRLSFALPVGEIFTDIMPFAAVNYYRWQRDNNEQKRWTTNWGISYQMGFNTWISRRWNLQFFAKSQIQPVEVPKEFFGSVENQGTAMSITRAGVALGYYFFEEKRKASKWFGLRQ